MAMASSAVPSAPASRPPLPIPEDIRETAYDCADAFSDWFGCDGEKRAALTKAFATALAQEREDCAFATETHSGFGDPATIEAVANIIRRRGLDEPPRELVHLTQGRYLELLQAEEITDRLRTVFEETAQKNSKEPF